MLKPQSRSLSISGMYKATLFTILMGLGHMVWSYQQPRELTVDPSTRQDLGLSEMASAVQSIPLPAEPIEKHVYVKDVLIDDESVFVSYKYERDTIHATAVYHFDRKGNYLGQIGMKKTLKDILYIADEQLLGIAYQKEVLFYNKEGKLVRAMPAFAKKYIYHKGILWGINWHYNGEFWEYQVLRSSKDGKEVIKVYQFDDPFKEFIGIQPVLTANDDALYLSFRLDHKVYRITETAVAAYELSFTKKDLPANRYMGPTQFVTGSWLYYGYNIRREKRALVYNSNTQKTYNLHPAPSGGVFAFIKDDWYDSGWLVPRPLNTPGMFYYTKSEDDLPEKHKTNSGNISTHLFLVTTQ